MIKAKGRPITGSPMKQSNKRPFVPNAKDTSANEETFIAQAPMPFKDSSSLAQSTPGTAAPGGVSTKEPKIASGLQHSNIGVRSARKRGRHASFYGE
ncbi:MAG TPA: hypothetical protein VN517_16165 [Terriglobales bacterium]|nr:hypothetical protein [Terriglobales bacterium]